MIVNDVYIENFRAFHNVTVNLGQRLTVIAGRNGTQKTTLLGILSQPFSLSQGKLRDRRQSMDMISSLSLKRNLRFL